jgi:4-amino-4-deoxy-L-arabinose transferase-like glycosyltransferase
MEVANRLPLVSSSADVSDRAKRFTFASIIAIFFFLAIAPTLTWAPFSKTVENLNIETALEIRRGGPMLIPTLMGEPRVRKPPLVAWITAVAINPLTVADMSSPDADTRQSAWKNLAWQTRWPALLCAALTLAFAYELGAVLLDNVGGILVAIVAGTSLLFLRFARTAATDVHLALWVTAANLCFAKFLFQRKYALGLIGAGAALGLAMMSKGPVAFVMTLAPLIVFLVVRKLVLGHSAVDWRRAIFPAAIGLLLMFAIGFIWFVYAWCDSIDVGRLWFMEVFRTDPAEAATSHGYDYFMLLAMLLPWMFFFIGGAMNAVTQMFSIKRGVDRERAMRLFYALLLILVPLLIMSFFRDRKVRYLYPFTVPCGILAAHALLRLFRNGIRTIGDRIIVWCHWLTLAGYALILPIAGTVGALGLRQIDGSAWYSWPMGVIAAASVAVTLVVTLIAFRRQRIALVLGTMLIMLGLHPLYILGMRNSRGSEGASEMLPVAQLLWQQYPDAIAYDVRDGRKRFPPDLAIYLNRPTLAAESIDAIPPLSHPQIYTNPQRRGDPQPPAAAGWRFLVKVPRDRDWHVVFVRDSQ